MHPSHNSYLPSMVVDFSSHKMTKRFLNVEYSVYKTRIDITDMEDLNQVRRAIKVQFGEVIAVAPQLQLYTNRNQLITDLDDITPEKTPQYFQKLTEGGSCVVIGTLPSPSRPVHLSLFLPCQIPFYNDIGKATELDGWLLFHQTVPSSSLNRLYIRESYKTIASSIQPGINKAIITGTPGIGKSLFLMYFLWKLVKTGNRVLLIYHPDIIYYDGQGGVFELDAAPSVTNHDFWNADLWCLFDAKGKKQHLGALPYGRCAFVLSTSPSRELVNDFKKPPVPQEFCMPTWSEAELETIASSFPGVIDWQERFRILGGIPRHVLEVTTDNPTKLLEAACMQCDLFDCIQIIHLNSTISTYCVHSLVHMTSTYPFTDSSVSYASATALDIIVANKRVEATRNTYNMVRLLESSAGNPLAASFCKHLFEPFVFELLEKGGDFRCRQLGHGTKRLKPADTVLTIPPSTRMVVDKVELGQVQNQLYTLNTKNEPVMSAWIPGIGAFQMNFGKTHDIEGSAKDDLVLLGNKLYWLLPPMYFESFTKKSPQDIDQYAVKIPYPTVGE
jgi:hypothetical protein